jgi:alpha-tubulin suppressor-like RCC1 family protein
MYREMRNFRRLGRRFLAGLAAGSPVLAAPVLAATVLAATVLALTVLAAAGTVPAAASPAVPRWIRIAAGGDFTCGIREGNTLWCWGSATAGDLGTGAATDQHQPHQIGHPTAAWVSVTAGQDHACALRRDGTLWCWGNNLNGETGASPGHRSMPFPRQVTNPAADGWSGVSAGGWHTCATRSDGTLWCWGFGASGQLGNGSTTDQSRPQQVTAPARDGWSSVSAGGGHTCAVRTGGTLWCWGAASGAGRSANTDVPGQISSGPAADGWSSVSAGSEHSCAIRADSTLWCWGRSLDGQLGTGLTGLAQTTPQQVTAPAADGWTSAETGGDTTCALRTHALWCWGANYSGGLGIGGTAGQSVPRRVQVPTRTGWSLVSTSGYATCATHTGHALWCWGYNGDGELGLGTTTDQHRPQPVTA